VADLKRGGGGGREKSFALPFFLAPNPLLFSMPATRAIKLQQHVAAQIIQCVLRVTRRLFLFRKRSLPFLTVDATNSNQAFSHDRCNTFPGFSYNKANNTFLNSLRKNSVEAQVEFVSKVMERARGHLSVKNDTGLVVYVLNLFGILAGRYGSVVVKERD